MSKLLTIAILATISSFPVKAQLKAFAGTDVKICLGAFALTDSPLLGGSPSATGGTPPYQYRWKLQESWFGSASFFLNSDTIANPRLKQLSGTDSAHFVLIVTDANSINAYDTVYVRLSRWGIYGSGGTLKKTDADTVTLNARSIPVPSFPPITYTWSPATFLSDSTILKPLCWSKGFVHYTLWATDAIGCKEYAWDLSVNSTPLSVSTLPGPDECILIPNPFNTSGTIQIGKFWLGSTLSIYSASGQLILQEVVNGNSVWLPLPLQTGTYFYNLRNKNGLFKTGKFFFGH